MLILSFRLFSLLAPPGVRDLFVVAKPERDSTVANRLIGAALGIRLPAPAAKAGSGSGGASASSGGMSSSSGGRRAPSPPREDAWDD